MKKVQHKQVGIVVKKSSERTLKVRVERKRPHPIYGKVVTSHKNYLVDADEKQIAEVNLGAKVIISECKPVSKKKTWRLDEIVLNEVSAE